MIARQPLAPLPHPLSALETVPELAHLRFVPYASDPALEAANDRGPSALAVLEIDDMPAILEDHGQVSASLTVLSVMRAIRSGLPATANAVRRGRTTIEITLPGCDLKRAREHVAATLDAIRQQPLCFGGEVVCVTLSAGIAADRDAASDDGLLRRAEGALREARRSGRGRVCLDLASA